MIGREDEDAPAVYRAALLLGAKELGLTIDPSLADRMALHYALVARWAERINLTAIKDPKGAAALHGLDSLLFTKLIEPADRSRAVDVGSGAGFPGIVVALARPGLAMTLLEPARKKASFLRVALADLGLDQVRVVEERLLSDDPALRPFWPAELIISRATIPPLELIPRAAEKLGIGGRLVTTSGLGALPKQDLESAAGGVGLSHEARHEFALPGGETRILDVFRREGR